MSEEKMEALPCPFCGGQVDPDGWLDGNGKRGPECEGCGATAESMDVWNSRAALQESEAGAVAEIYVMEDFETGADVNTIRCLEYKLIENLPHGAKLFLAPPSAPAIETASIMKCVELAGWDGNVHQSKLLELIPQDGRTQLEQKCMEVANAAFDFGYYDCESPAVDCVEPKLRAIVTNLIGAAK